MQNCLVSVRAAAVQPVMDGIIQSFYRPSERGQSVQTDKSQSSVIFHGSTRHMYGANVTLRFPRKTAPPRPMANTKVLGQTLTSGEGRGKVWGGQREGRGGGWRRGWERLDGGWKEDWEGLDGGWEDLDGGWHGPDGGWKRGWGDLDGSWEGLDED